MPCQHLMKKANVGMQILNLFFLTLYTIKWSENAIRLRESNFVYLSGIETQVTSIFCNWPTGWRFFLGGRFWGKKVKDKLSQIFLGWTHRGFLESARRAGLMADFFRQLNSSSQLLITPTFDWRSLAKLQILWKDAQFNHFGSACNFFYLMKNHYLLGNDIFF